MANVGQNILVVSIAVIGSMLFQAGLNHIWPWEKRRTYIDLIGWHFSILGTTYAVILGFMLYAVWTAFGEADLNVDLEANAVVDMHHLAKGLPEPQRTQLQTLAGSYADTVITRDWPQTARGEVPEGSGGDQIGNVAYGDICPGGIGDRDYRPTARAVATQLP